jgi:hypothetical protein
MAVSAPMELDWEAPARELNLGIPQRDSSPAINDGQRSKCGEHATIFTPCILFVTLEILFSRI